LGGSSTKARPTRLPPAARRAQLIDVAARLCAERHVVSVGFTDVASAAGVSRSLVYAYFGDQGGLLAALYVHNLEQLDQELGRSLDDRLPDAVRLRRIVRRYLVFARDNQDAWNVIAAAGALQHPAILAARRGRIERIAAVWGGSPSARLVAGGVVALLEAGAQDWVEYHDAGLERATDVLFAVLWEGLSGLPARGLVAAS
jgi:AcrR family transcriptional regulator